MNDFIKKVYFGVKCIVFNLKSIICVIFNFDDLEDFVELNGMDLVVIDGKIGVVENGGVWIE